MSLGVLESVPDSVMNQNQHADSFMAKDVTPLIGPVWLTRVEMVTRFSTSINLLHGSCLKMQDLSSLTEVYY